jgi:hypothetical protein
MRRHERNHAAAPISKASFAVTAIAGFSMSTAPEWRVRVSAIFDRRSQRHPAIDGMRLARDVARLVRGEKQGERSDLLRRAEPAHGLAIDEGLAHVVLRGEAEQPKSGLPDFGTYSGPKSAKADFG